MVKVPYCQLNRQELPAKTLYLASVGLSFFKKNAKGSLPFLVCCCSTARTLCVRIEIEFRVDL